MQFLYIYMVELARFGMTRMTHRWHKCFVCQVLLLAEMVSIVMLLWHAEDFSDKPSVYLLLKFKDGGSNELMNSGDNDCLYL